MKEIVGRIHSYQSLGTVDGPGVRFVVFTQGCNLRCGCCHNPDTWEMNAGTLVKAEDVFNKALKYKNYFGDLGGVTISGGEPLLQPKFCAEIFSLCKQNGINTCLDTSGSVLSDELERLIDYTDRVLLDVKYTSNEQYEKYVGMEYQRVLDFLTFLEEKNIPVTIRQVIIPTLNDNVDNVKELNLIANKYKVVDKIELLPFKKICATKYKSLGINFAFEKFDIPTNLQIENLYCYVDEKFKKDY